MKASLARRSELLAGTRAFFAGRGFTEVETPVLVPSPGMDLHLDAFPVDAGRAGRRYLATSPEYQMKRLLAGAGAGEPGRRHYQITRAFRRGELGVRHNPEFTLLELYRAPGTMEDVIRDTEQLVARLTGGFVQLGARARAVDVRPPLPRLAVADAFERWAGVPARDVVELAEADEDQFYRLLVERVEPALEAEPRGVFLWDYPACQASLARRRPGAPELAERFELYVAGVELCNGFGELVDPAEQRARFEADAAARAAAGLDVYPVDEALLEALAHVPPAGGVAIGLDRVFALACGSTSIADVIAFPFDAL